VPDCDCIIIGGGIAGLSAALHLAERGVKPWVLEADPGFIGGRIKGGAEVELNGWKFRGEHGVHGIWSPYRNLQAMLARHRLRPVFVPAQEECWIYRRGDQINHADVGSAIRHSFIPAPFHYLNLFFRPAFLGTLGIADLFSLFRVWYGLLFAVGIDPLLEEQPLAKMRLSDLLKGWSPALRAFFIGLTRSGLAASPEEIPLSGYIAFLRFYTILRRDSWAFSYIPADGGSGLSEPLARRIVELGGQIRLGARVVRLEKVTDGWQVSIETGETRRASQVILAVDAPAAQRLLTASQATAEVAQSLYWPRGQANAVVRVWFDRQPNPGAEAGIFSGDFILDNYFWLDRIQDPYINWRRETGGSAIEAHIYGPPSLLEEPDSLLLTRAISDIQSAFTELRGHRIHQVIQRNPASHTLFGIGPKELHLGITTPWEGLYCCGDWVRHPAPCLFLERACLTGIDAANSVLQTRGLPPWPLLDYLPPEPFVGWIERLMLKGRKARKKGISK
jgi:carotenoid phi-ring synthase / carotenoid chi-ring synthase